MFQSDDGLGNTERSLSSTDDRYISYEHINPIDPCIGSYFQLNCTIDEKYVTTSSIPEEYGIFLKPQTMRAEVTQIAYWQLSNAKQSLQVASSSVKIRIIALNSNVDQSCLIHLPSLAIR